MNKIKGTTSKSKVVKKIIIPKGRGKKIFIT
jgi:hypothetical protein